MLHSDSTSGAAAAAALLLTVLLAAAPGPARAALGDCGQPSSSGDGPKAADALEVLRTAVGLNSCGGFDDCVCDVDSSGSVAAGDALRVLRKAVGQDITLSCACSGTTTTSTTTTTLPPPASVDFLVLVRESDSSATADLEGTWDISSVVSGPGAPRWSRGAITIASNGNFSGSTTDSDSNNDAISGRFSVSGNGLLTCTQDCYDSFEGAVDPDKTVLAATQTWDEDGTTEMFVAVRRGPSYVQGDLAGNWNMGSISSGTGLPEWSRGSLAIGSDGSTTGSEDYSGGGFEEFELTLALSGSGAMSCPMGCDESFAGALDSGKTVAVATETNGTGANFRLLGRAASGCTPADLEGSWHVSTLVAGADAPLWQRGLVAISGAGAISGTLTLSDGSMEAVGGTFSIDGDCIVTINEEESDLTCAMDAGKTVLICTETF